MGLWEQILAEFFMRARGKLWGIDSTSCRVHKHAFVGVKGSDYQDIGTSRGGSNTKIHALCDANGRIIDIFLSPGHRHDSNYAELLCDHVPKGITILADKAYDSDRLIQALKERDVKFCIPSKTNPVSARKVNKGHYKKRHHIENAFQRLKEFRAISTRYEKHSENFLAITTLGAILAWI
jgi:transposase